MFTHITPAAKTDIGCRRKNNEDNFATFPDVGVWLVADGMGGGDDGEIASAAVVRAVESFVRAQTVPGAGNAYTAKDYFKGLRHALNEASAWIFERARERRLESCGSTVVGALFDATHPGRALAFHAGDSRLYRLRGKSLKQITRDHSAAEMIGEKDEAKVNPMFRGMILRAVGIRSTVEVDATPFNVKKDDRIVICSDGLSRMVPDEKIAEIICTAPSTEAAVENLIAAAKAAGGVDNVTVIVLQVGTLPPARKAVSFVEVGTSFKDTEGNTGGDSPVTLPTGILLPDKNPASSADTAVAPFDVESDLPLAAQSSSPNLFTRRLPRLLLFGAILLFLAILIVVFCIDPRARAQRSVPVPPSGSSVTNVSVGSGAVPILPSAQPLTNAVAVTTNAPAVMPPPTVKPPAGKPAVAPQTTVKSPAGKPAVAPPPTVKPPAGKPVVAPPPTVKPPARKPAAIKSSKVTVEAELLAVCSRKKLDLVAEQIRRKLPANKAFEFSEQMKMALNNVQTIEIQKSDKAVASFLVDFQYALQAAEPARQSFSANPALLSAWDVVVKGDVHSAVFQKAAACVVRELSK